MFDEKWDKANRGAINRRVDFLRDKPEGVLMDRKSELHRFMVTKENNLIRLFFLDPFADGGNQKASGCMSEYDLADPLNLIIAYTQALLLPLLWQPEPKRVYEIGFAGGRVPLVLHHYFPELIIDNTDIDSLVESISTRYFGLEFDDRLHLHIEDGRKFLETRDKKDLYDFILVDAFKGTGHGPYMLSTTEFYGVCKANMPEDGVVMTNLIERDPLFLEKINAIRASFKNVYVHFDPSFIETYLLLGTDGDLLDEAARSEKAG